MWQCDLELHLRLNVKILSIIIVFLSFAASEYQTMLSFRCPPKQSLSMANFRGNLFECKSDPAPVTEICRWSRPFVQSDKTLNFDCYLRNQVVAGVDYFPPDIEVGTPLRITYVLCCVVGFTMKPPLLEKVPVTTKDQVLCGVKGYNNGNFQDPIKHYEFSYYLCRLL